MVAFNQYAHINMQGNEIQNVNLQNLATAPTVGVTTGRFYFDTTNHTMYVYNGTDWIDALSQGDYTFQNGVELVDGTRNVQLKIASGANAGNIALSADSNGLAATVAEASTSGKGIIEIATDEEAATGTSEVLAVNPKQLATKVTANTAITGATKCKITYDAKGLVTSGADLEAADIPNLSLSKITDVTASAAEVNVLDGITASTAELNILDGVTADATEINVLDGITATTSELNILSGVTADATEINVLDGITASTAELNILDGVTVTASDINSVTDKIELTDLSIASASANYLTYNNTTGEFGANVDTTVTASSTNLVTSGAVESAIAAAIVGGVTYKGTWDITSATDFSGITLPVKKGYLYYVVGTGPKTIGGIEWNAGDYLLVNDDVAAGGSLTGKVEKIDNTEAADIVRTDATQTITNKTIDADDNTISDLTTTNFKSGVIVTSVGTTSTASNDSIATELAVANAIDDFITASSTDTLTNKTIDADDNTVENLELDNMKSGVVQTTVRSVSSATDTSVATEKAVATGLSVKVEKLTATNPALTATAGVCTWTITNTLGSADVQVNVYQSGVQVGAAITVSSSTITIAFNSATDIAAETFTAVVTGL